MTIFEVPDQLNTVALTNLPFKHVQTARLVMILLLAIVMVMLFFVLVRMAFFYFSFWSVVLLWWYLLMVGLSAGRQVVEQKLTAKLVEQAKSDPKVSPSLPEEEKSKTWRSAVVLFGLALPLVFMNPILIYATDVRYDIACELAYLGNSVTNNLTTCRELIYNSDGSAN